MLYRHGKYTPVTLLTLLSEQNGPTTVLVNTNTGEERPFTFDYSFWSHDGFQEDPNGIYVPTSPKYAD